MICEEEQDDVEERDESMLSPTPSTSTSSTSSCVNSSKSKKQPKLKDIFVKQKSFQGMRTLNIKYILYKKNIFNYYFYFVYIF